MVQNYLKQGNSWRLVLATVILGFVWGCQPAESGGTEPKPLPVINQEKMPPFRFMNQDSQWVTPATVLGKIHVIDFFFTSCPTICPRMKANMLTVYEEFRNDERVTMVSHSIDTRHDSVPVLHDYAERLEVEAPLWHFVTGEKDSIMGIARKYMVTAMEDASAPGGYAHSGAMILFDKDRNIRGYYDGTSETETAEMVVDMRRLLDEK